ncbi:saccharopine dehydrogenase family protein [Geodermatophilus obscurus]|uniref:Saccharopine dehydrogenase n=1 Tax=Geodermatophilus obscurus (strain ATCC 25078 / DSM 43160 / JCM 3152 / CCUG 61914 / KCC A-0152 / KCTC 9177 / NBRC 13315 / NRRL B-3577 / G-20) TaxID=526225 RepID=D2SF37_GEOOG|nr:saccharopine dehydrogenase NADP-binding domain-containing protein [Geodermatophilus obscurus]ADB74727.1 Saccharopine dehydrogenase [Geodermatophilus obscurus DSM 43160]
MSDPARTHDLVVYGATGFVGRLLAAYLAGAAPTGLRIALAGRSRSRLEQVRGELPAAARDWPLVEADSTDAGSLTALAASTGVLATTVGPYLRHGLPVVEACARAGTHYADLTGEVLFVRRAIDRTDAVARETGARIVHACGYDSVPSDLSALLLAERARLDGASGLRDVQLVATARGGISGGTVASVRAQFEELGRDSTARRLVGDPFALSPDRDAEPETRQPRDAAPPSRTPDGRWTATFLMAPFNTRVVRRSNALQDWAYGRGLRYGEVMGCGRGIPGAVTAAGVTAGLAGVVAAMSLPPTRSLLDRVLPEPGAGPGEETRARGWFRMDVDATTEGGRRYRATAAGQGDPGYAATALMLGETALALALDGDRLPGRAGSLTPATALGSVLVDRLRAAGHTYEVAEL